MRRRALDWTPVRFLREVLRRYREDQSGVLAGYIAYASMLSAFPFIIFAATLAGVLIGERYSGEALNALFEPMPQRISATLRPVLDEVLGHERGGVLTVTAVGAIWAASNGVEAVRIGLDRAYDVATPRSFLMNRLLSIGFVFLGFGVFGALAVLIVFAPLAFSLIEALTPVTIPAGVNVVRYLVGAGLLYAFFWVMHLTLPGRAMRGMRLGPGILISMLIWVMLASALSLYLAYAPSYTLTYGALAGAIVTLLFFYMTGVAIILGAQVNAVVNYGLPPVPQQGAHER